MTKESMENKVALITGGSEGIGYGIADAFLDAGAKVVITGRTQSKLDSAVESLGSGVTAIASDVSVAEGAADVINKVLENHGRLDILVNNAGIAMIKPISECTVEDYDTIFDPNVRGLFALTQAAISELRKSKGNIINIASSVGVKGSPRWGVYSASKAALLMLSDLWAVDLAPDVRVNCISPGGMDTPLYYKLFGEETENFREMVKGVHLTGRLGTAEEIARAALFVATETWVTGSNLTIDGGLIHKV